MKKIILFLLALCTNLYCYQQDEILEQNSNALIRNYQSVNQATHVINAHKQALQEVISAIYAHNTALQKSQNLFQDQQETLKNSSDSMAKNTLLLEKSMQMINEAVNSNQESAEEVRKIIAFFKHLPWILLIFFALLILPSLIMLWAIFDLKKTLKK